MRFDVTFSASSEVDLGVYRVFEQRTIIDGVKQFLAVDADKPSKRRKRMVGDRLAPWELRLGDYRVFYEIGDTRHVKIIAIGHKEHNELFIRGIKVQL